jgi:hypothetical protein
MKPEARNCVRGKLVSAKLEGMFEHLASARFGRQPLFGDSVVHMPACAVQGSEEFELWHSDYLRDGYTH